jgi:hypothetical protein
MSGFCWTGAAYDGESGTIQVARSDEPHYGRMQYGRLQRDPGLGAAARYDMKPLDDLARTLSGKAGLVGPVSWYP